MKCKSIKAEEMVADRYVNIRVDRGSTFPCGSAEKIVSVRISAGLHRTYVWLTRKTQLTIITANATRIVGNSAANPSSYLGVWMERY